MSKSSQVPKVSTTSGAPEAKESDEELQRGDGEELPDLSSLEKIMLPMEAAAQGGSMAETYSTIVSVMNSLTVDSGKVLLTQLDRLKHVADRAYQIANESLHARMQQGR